MRPEHLLQLALGRHRYHAGLSAQLPPHPTPPAIKADKALVTGVIAVLMQGRLSRFQFEGACIHGLRVALILGRGFNWPDANASAHWVVREALRRIGAVRPTAEMADRQAVDVREDCRQCGGQLDPDSGEPWRYAFCSRHCVNVWNLRNDSTFKYYETRAYLHAKNLAFFKRLPEQTCPQCGRAFRPSTFRPQTYCSHKCFGEANRIYQERVCPGCGEPFMPRNRDQVFCCPEHAAAATRKREERCCANPGCGNHFYPKTDDSKYCSRACMFADQASGGLAEKRCAAPGCGRLFRPKSPAAKFCSKKCWNDDHNAKRRAASKTDRETENRVWN